MASQYAKELEKNLAAGMEFGKAHKTALGKVGASRTKKAKGERLTTRVSTKLKMIYYGKKYHKKTGGKKFKPTGKRG